MNSLREEAYDLTEAVARQLGFINVTHHETSAETAAAAVTIEPTTGGPVSRLSDTLHNFAATLEHYDDEALAKLDAVQGNPATAEAFDIIHALSGYDPGPVFKALLTAMKALVPAPAAEPAPEPSFTPAGPQVAGQA